MRKEFFAGMVLLMLLLAGCKQQTKSETVPFKGGTTGILMEFMEGAPPSEVFDGGNDKFTVMVVQHPESLKGIVNAGGVFFEADPATITGKRALDKDTKVVILRKGNNWMKVEVKSGKYAGQAGWILNKYFTDN